MLQTKWQLRLHSYRLPTVRCIAQQLRCGHTLPGRRIGDERGAVLLLSVLYIILYKSGESCAIPVLLTISNSRGIAIRLGIGVLHYLIMRRHPSTPNYHYMLVVLDLIRRLLVVGTSISTGSFLLRILICFISL